MSLPGSQNTVVMKRVSQGSFLQRTALKHNVIFTEGSKGEEAYLLVDGKVEISGSVDGRKKVFAILKPISMFGEMALFLDDHGRTATAIALEDSKLVVLNQDDLHGYIESCPPAISAMLNTMVSRLKSTTKKALRAPNVPLGIVRVLDLCQSNGASELHYDVAVRHMADLFVCGPQTIEGYIHGLASQGHVAVDASGPAASGRRVLRILTANLLHTVASAPKPEGA